MFWTNSTPHHPLIRLKLKKNIFLVWKKIWLNFSKAHHFFLWVDTGNLNIVEESSLSPVSRTTWHFFLIRFSSHTGQVFKKWNENLNRVIWKPDGKKNCQVVLDTRDSEDSFTMFRFPVSTHKKSDALLKNLVRIFFKHNFLFFLF